MKIDLIELINKSIDVYNNALPLMAKKDINFKDIEALVAPLRTVDTMACVAARHLEVLVNCAVKNNDSDALDACANLCLVDLPAEPKQTTVKITPSTLGQSKTIRFTKN